MTRLTRNSGRSDWNELEFVDRERTPSELMKFGIQLHLAALSSLALCQLVFFHLAIDSVFSSYSNAQIVQTIRVRSVDCPPMNDGSGQRAF